jgi:hypothetical protein
MFPRSRNGLKTASVTLLLPHDPVAAIGAESLKIGKKLGARRNEGWRKKMKWGMWQSVSHTSRHSPYIWVPLQRHAKSPLNAQ